MNSEPRRVDRLPRVQSMLKIRMPAAVSSRPLIRNGRPVARDPLGGSVREPLAGAREASGLSILVDVDWSGHALLP
jgi:hypothetical protein